MSNLQHYPVLLKEVIEKMNIIPDGTYVDCTFGAGGYSKEIYKNLDKKGKLISFDLDIESEKLARKIFKGKSNFYFHRVNFSEIGRILREMNINVINGIVYDLGLSNLQLNDPKKGFTYKTESKLDMRIDKNNTLDAMNILNTYSLEELKNVFKKYGDEKKALMLASEIIKYREKKEITLNLELNEIIDKVKNKHSQKHKLKNIYQSLRMEVNNDIFNIKTSLKAAVNFLDINSILMVVTFNSLEDRVVKEFFWEKKQEIVPNSKNIERVFTTKKTVYPTKEEVLQNRASRSAKLRILKKINDYKF